MEIKHYNTDTSNWGEDDNLKLKGAKIYDNTYTFKQILDIAYDLKAPIIIKTSYKSEKTQVHGILKTQRIQKYCTILSN